MHAFKIQTRKKQEIIEITSLIKELVAKSGVQNGLCVVYVPHATAAIGINENADSRLNDDILEKLEKIAPSDAVYKHDDGNAHAHIKASLISPSETVIVKDGKLQLGTWQGIALYEFDGPRTRNVYVEIVEKK